MGSNSSTLTFEKFENIHTLVTSGLLPKCTEDVIDAKASQRVLGIPL